MKRFLILFNNGILVQQSGLNTTYHQLHGLGIIKLIIDTKTGKCITADKWEWRNITVYEDPTLTDEIN